MNNNTTNNTYNKKNIFHNFKNYFGYTNTANCHHYHIREFENCDSHQYFNRILFFCAEGVFKCDVLTDKCRQI